MWISKQEYTALKNVADQNERDAASYRKLMLIPQSTDSIYLLNNLIVMSSETFNKLYDKNNSYEDELKKAEAELTWYKVKYQEATMNTF